MAEITAALVKELRDKTGAGMMDCKKALTETGGDMDQAVDWLRKKGLSAAAKKAGRVAAEGLVAVAVSEDGRRGALVEVNAETDFVARNETFQAFVGNVARLALETGGDVDKLANADYPGGGTVSEQLTELIATVGENMSLRRTDVVEVDKGLVGSYVHSAVGPDLGKIAVLIGLETAAEGDKFAGVARQLAMHIAAARPEAVGVADLDQAAVQRERDVLTDQAKSSGKPDEIIAKMVEGRLRKYYQEVVLTEQVFVIDGESRVSDVLDKAGKEAGQPIAINRFVRYELGEGIEKKSDDFAAEVAAAAGGN